MKPLFHPAVDDISVEAILHALSDPLRAAIYAEIAGSNCPHICSSFLHFRDQCVPKSTLSQHFKALREAGLIHSERHGVELRNTSRAGEIEARFPGLIPAIVRAHLAQSRRQTRTMNSGNPKRAAGKPRVRKLVKK